VSTAFDFTGAAGQRLTGRLEAPVGRARGHALFAHCFSCSKDSLAAARISRALAARGFGVLRFDFSGLGESGGEFGRHGISGDSADLLAAAEAMTAAGMAPSLVVGHSLGGVAALRAAGEIASVKAVATVATPFAAEHVTDQFKGALEEIRANGEAQVKLEGRPFTLRASFLDDLERDDPAQRIGRLGRALLILHSPVDSTVAIDNANAIYRAAKHPKSFVSLDTANHLLTRAADAEYAAEVIAAWASRYLPARAPSVGGESAPPSVAEASGPGLFLTDITIGEHVLVADEPVTAGGLDTGPTPYGLLGAGLAACTAMTLRVYADKKGWPRPDVKVEVEHTRTPERRDVFVRKISLPAGLDAERRAAFIAVADRCPVHRTLEKGAAIETEDADAPRAMPPAEPCEQHAEDTSRACDE